MAIYHSLGVDGVPFGVRYPSESYARDAAQKAMGEFNDLDKVEILKVTTQSFGFEYRKTPKAGPALKARVDEIVQEANPKPFDPFDGIGL